MSSLILFSLMRHNKKGINECWESLKFVRRIVFSVRKYMVIDTLLMFVISHTIRLTMEMY